MQMKMMFMNLHIQQVLGRAASAGAGEAFAIGAPSVGADTGTQFVLTEAEEGGKGTVNFAFDLVAFNSEKTIKDAENLKCISSFTVGGAVDSTVTFNEGDVKIQAVYQMEVLTADEKAAITAAASNTGGVSTDKQQMMVK